MESHMIIKSKLEEILKPLWTLTKKSPPIKGWIRSIRHSLGINDGQLANRLGVSPAHISQLEQEELSGDVTIKTMRNTAEALGCDFVYVLVPKEDIISR